MRQTEPAAHDTYTTPESDSERTTLEIVTRVAAAKGCRPTDLEPLSNVTDPDALERLCRGTASANFEARFDYEGGRVVVSSDGGVEFSIERE